MKNQKGFIPLVILILVVMVAAIGGAYYFGTVKNKPSLSQVAPILTPPVSPQPSTVSTINPTTNPTANWKIYTNISSHYTLKYPITWNIGNIAAGALGGTPVPDARYIQIAPPLINNKSYGVIGFEELDIIPPSEEKSLTINKKTGDLTFSCNSDFASDSKTWCYIKVPNQEKYLNVQVFKNVDEEINKTFDQILSTFQFTN